MMLRGNALYIPLANESVQCVVTSPPYWGLRDYGTAKWEGGDAECSHAPRPQIESSKTNTNAGALRDKPSLVCKCGAIRIDAQLGLEKTPDEYVAKMVQVFREVRRVLRKDGTLWLNLGDSYAGSWGNSGNRPELDKKGGIQRDKNCNYLPRGGWDDRRERPASAYKIPGIKPKDLIGIPWRVAVALQADGWWLRSDIIWAKANCMPESVRDRPTRSHEYLFLLTKSAKYFYDADAIKEPCLYDVDGTGTAARKARQAESNKSMPTGERAGIRPGVLQSARAFDGKNSDKQRGHSRRHDGFNDRWDLMEQEEQCSGYRNKRDVWNISPAQYPDAHFAVFPPKLTEPCILAGSKPGDIVMDPFSGSGTTVAVAERFGRRGIGIELNPAYIHLAQKRCYGQPLSLGIA